jgi:hypothetical protein
VKLLTEYIQRALHPKLAAKRAEKYGTPAESPLTTHELTAN